MKNFILAVSLVLLALCLTVSADAARPVKGGASNSDFAPWIGVNVVSYQGSFVFCPTETMFDYYRSKNWTLIRMPISATLLWPNQTGAFETSYLGCLDSVADYAAERGIRIILDLHSGGSRNQLNDAKFAEFWNKLADHFKDHLGIDGYDLQNEPGGNEYNATPEIWFDRAQGAIDAIREVDMNTPVYLESVQWSSAWLWPTWSDAVLAVTDPADKIVYSAHAYADNNSSGSNFTWLDEVAKGDTLDPNGCTPGVNCSTLDTNILVKRYTPFVSWCRKFEKRCHIGESGVGRDHPDWLTTLDNGVQFLVNNDVEFTYWSAGGGWGEYPMTIEPSPLTGDRPQAAVLSKHAGNYIEGAITITGPQRGDEDAASDDITYTYNGYIRRPFTIIPTSSEPGTFTPSSISCSVGFNCSGTVTFTADDAAVNVLSATNNGSVRAPVEFGYATVEDSFANANMVPVNAFGLRKIYAPYLGPAVRLRRAVDNEERDFYFTSSQLNASLDTTAIQQWAGLQNVYVVTWYDQGPGKRHAGPATSDRTPSTNDQPQLVLDCGNSKPCIRFNGANAMQATSPVNNISGQTMLWIVKPTQHLGKSPFSWRFLNNQHVIYGKNTDDQFYIRRLDGGSPPAGNIIMRGYHQDGLWQSAGATWTRNTTDGAAMWMNSTIVGKVNTPDTSIVYPNRTALQIGYNYIGGGFFDYFVGDMRELVVYNSNITNDQMKYFQDDQTAHYGIDAWDDWVWPTPTLEQNIGSANAFPWRGVNQGGIGFGTNFNSLPVPAAQTYYVSRGFNITRFPVSWEMIQQNLCTGDTTLNATQMALLDQAVIDVTSSGMDILIDLHNYGNYNYTYGGRVCASPPDSGNIVNATTGAYYANVWGQLAARYKDNPKVHIDLMNEPNGQAALTQAPKFQAAIDAIRAADFTSYIMVEFGSGYAACGQIDDVNGAGAAFLTLTDPEDKLILSCHNYLRNGTAGDFFCPDCDDYASQGKGLGIVTDATAWAKANDVKLFLGEFGIGFTQSAYSEGKKMLDYIHANEDSGSGGWIGWSAWGGGPSWNESYKIMFEPRRFTAPIADRPNMKFLSTYATGGTWPGLPPAPWPNDVVYPQ